MKIIKKRLKELKLSSKRKERKSLNSML